MDASLVRQISLTLHHPQLLVLLEDVSSKRKADKARLRAEGLEVSDDEEEEEEIEDYEDDDEGRGGSLV